LYKLTVSKDFSWNIMNELGKMQELHFINCNHDLQPHELQYTYDIRNCDDALKKIDYIERQNTKNGIEMKGCENIKQFFEKIKDLGGELGKANHLLFNEISKDLTSTHAHIKSQ
jgi:V-type H+-transporting ATPase subunit a